MTTFVDVPTSSTSCAPILGDEGVLTDLSARYNRTRVPAPFPVHRWAELRARRRRPADARRSRSAEVVKLANRYRIPVVARAGGTGLNDGARAAQARHRRRRQADEPDQGDRPGRPHGDRRSRDQHAQAQRGAPEARGDLPGRPGLVPVLAGRRPDRDQRLVADRRPLRPHPGPRHQLPDRAPDRRDHRGRRRRRAEDPQVVDRLPAQAPVHGPPGHARDRHRGDARAGPPPGGRVRRLLRTTPTSTPPGESTGALATSGLATLAGVVLFDEWKVRYLRRDDEAYIPQPGPREGGRGDRHVRDARRGRAGGAAAAADRPRDRRQLPRRRDLAGRLGLAPRPLRHAAPRAAARRPGGADELALRGRGDQLQRSCPAVHGGVARHRRRATSTGHGIFDDWGMFSYTNGAYKPWGDYLVEIDIGIWEQKLDDENWAAWVACKREIAAGGARLRRLDHRLPRRDPGGRRRARARSRWAAAST